MEMENRNECLTCFKEQLDKTSIRHLFSKMSYREQLEYLIPLVYKSISSVSYVPTKEEIFEYEKFLLNMSYRVLTFFEINYSYSGGIVYNEYINNNPKTALMKKIFMHDDIKKIHEETGQGNLAQFVLYNILV